MALTLDLSPCHIHPPSSCRPLCWSVVSDGSSRRRDAQLRPRATVGPVEFDFHCAANRTADAELREELHVGCRPRLVEQRAERSTSAALRRAVEVDRGSA